MRTPLPLRMRGKEGTMLHNLSAISQETLNLIIEYVFYGGIFIIGLIILLFMKRRSRRPAALLAQEETERTIRRIDKLIENLNNEKNDYTFPARLLRLSGEIGDLVLLADRELTENGNIAFDGVLSAYKAAADKVASIDVIWERERAAERLAAAKADLQRGLGVIEQLKTGKKKTV